MDLRVTRFKEKRKEKKGTIFQDVVKNAPRAKPVDAGDADVSD